MYLTFPRSRFHTHGPGYERIFSKNNLNMDFSGMGIYSSFSKFTNFEICVLSPDFKWNPQ